MVASVRWRGLCVRRHLPLRHLRWRVLATSATGQFDRRSLWARFVPDTMEEEFMRPSVTRLVLALSAAVTALLVALTLVSAPATAAYASGNRERRPHPQFAAQAQRLGLT